MQGKNLFVRVYFKQRSLYRLYTEFNVRRREKRYKWKMINKIKTFLFYFILFFFYFYFIFYFFYYLKRNESSFEFLYSGTVETVIILFFPYWYSLEILRIFAWKSKYNWSTPTLLWAAEFILTQHRCALTRSELFYLIIYSKTGT